MAKPPKFSPEEKHIIRVLHEESGVSYKDLAFQFDVSYNTIRRICEPDVYAKHLQRSREYQKQNSKSITAQNLSKQRRFFVSFNRLEDAAIIDYIESHDNVSQYFRDLILRDMRQK